VVAFLLVVTAVLWGAVPIIEKIGLARVDPLVAVTVRSFIVTVSLLTITFLAGKGNELMDMDRRSLFLFGASGIMSGVLAMWTYFAALKMEATSKIVPIAATYPLVTTLLGILILGEGLTFARIIGTALIVSGIWLVK
jgi:bacterial/archaeal transporter family protein